MAQAFRVSETTYAIREYRDGPSLGYAWRREDPTGWDAVFMNEHNLATYCGRFGKLKNAVEAINLEHLEGKADP
jgi:hypothetical protein